MAGALQRAWLGRGPLAWALRPLSLLYGVARSGHRGLYATGLLRVERLPVPVIVVGNVIAGGAGKTPMVLALLEHLRQRGIAAGVVSRGWGRSAGGCAEVRPDDDAVQVGDEPLLLRRKGGAPVFVAARRAEAGRALLAAHPATRVIISDDGLQHHALARDIEVCVFDGRGVGNGWLLPAGPLREPWPRRVDLVVCHGEPAGIEGHRMERALAPFALRSDGQQVPLARLAGGPAQAVAGIATPEGFFSQLRAAGLRLDSARGLPDHHVFTLADLPPGQPLLCTEKDAVKLWRLRPDALAVPLQVRLDPSFWTAFDRLLDARLSSPDGPSPA